MWQEKPQAMYSYVAYPCNKTLYCRGGDCSQRRKIDPASYRDGQRRRPKGWYTATCPSDSHRGQPREDIHGPWESIPCCSRLPCVVSLSPSPPLQICPACPLIVPTGAWPRKPLGFLMHINEQSHGAVLPSEPRTMTLVAYVLRSGNVVID